MILEKKKVLVTGADGFIGSHLTELLIRSGADVTALVQYNSFNSWGWIDKLDKDLLSSIKVVSGDVREYDGVKKIVKGQEVIFHLAALIAIPYSYHSPMAYVRTNVEGTANVLEAAREYGVEKLIHTSTSETYGTAIYAPIDESHPLHGQSPYSASKIAADKLAESYFRSYNLPVVTARPFNTYGPRQSARAVITTIIVQALSNVKELNLGDLLPTRDFTYVADTVRGLVMIAQCENIGGETINIGSGSEITIGDLASKILGLMNAEVKIRHDDERMRPSNSEVNRLLADNQKIKKLTLWEPKYSLDEGLMQTIEWMKDNIKYYKPNIYNL
jgi:NAD dependent epimerase/dehydratase